MSAETWLDFQQGQHMFDPSLKIDHPVYQSNAMLSVSASPFLSRVLKKLKKSDSISRQTTNTIFGERWTNLNTVLFCVLLFFIIVFLCCFFKRKSETVDREADYRRDLS